MANELTYQSEFTGQQMDERFTAVAMLSAALEALTGVVAQKYVKPTTGIPSTDMNADVQAALAKALTAVQSLADYYTKDEVDALLAAINAQKYVDVSTLPTASASTMGKIYLVGPDGSGYYSYYISSYDGSAYSWVGPLGTTEISLANYATKAELSQLDQKVGKVAIPITGYNQRIVLNGGIGTQIPAATEYSGVNYSRFPVVPGDIVIVNGTGANLGRLWGFIDADGYILSISDANITAVNLVLTVPTNAAEVIINTSDSSVPCYYFSVNSSEYKIDGLNNRLTDLEINVSEEEASEASDAAAALSELGAEVNNYNQIDVTPSEYRVGYYSGTLSNFNYADAFRSAIIPTYNCKAIVVEGKTVATNCRVFDEDGVEILKNSGAYFPSVKSGRFVLPSNACFFSFVYNYNDEPTPANIKVYRAYPKNLFIVASTLLGKIGLPDIKVDLIRVDDIRPNDAQTTFEALSSASGNSVYYFPIKEGCKIKVTATNSASKAIRIVFSHYPPVVGGSFDVLDYLTTASVNKEYIAPYTGFVSIYHNRNYFTDQAVVTNSHCFNGKVSLEGGDISNGFPVCEKTSRAGYMNKLRTPLFIKATEIHRQNLDEGETMDIVCYGSCYEYLGVVSQAEDLLAGTEYIKMVFAKSSEYTGLKTIQIYGYNQLGKYETRFNDVRPGGYITESLSFDVQMPLTSVDGVLDERHFDNGVLMFPVNYTREGEPVPLVIFWHGTGGFTFSSASLSYYDQMKFLRRNGFAVADCSGMTDKYQLGTDAVPGHDCRFNPLAVACFSALYDHIVRNFNVRRDGAFIFGKSNGGLGTAWLATMKPFPIKAAATLAPSLSTPESMRYSSDDNLNYWCARFGMTGYTYEFSDLYFQHETEQGNDFIIDNVSKWRMYDPLTLMSSVDTEELVTEMFKTGYGNQDVPGMWAIIDEGRKVLPAPMKIWHAVDDTSVPIVISRFFKKLVDRLNGVCELREIPAGYGGHHAVDISELAPTVTVQTKFAGEQTIVQTYAELVEWFNRWM